MEIIAYIFLLAIIVWAFLSMHSPTPRPKHKGCTLEDQNDSAIRAAGGGSGIKDVDGNLGLTNKDKLS